MSPDISPLSILRLAHGVLCAELIGGIGHRQKNAIVAVSGTIETTVRRVGSVDEAELIRRIRLARANTDQMSSPARALTDLGRLGLDLGREEAVELTGPTLVNGALATVEAAQLARNVAHRGAYSQETHDSFRGRRSELLLALMHLLLNADKAVAGSDTAEVTVSCKVSASEVSLAVTDNGPGLPADLAELVRLRLDTDERLGSGLVCAAVVAARHGGQLEQVARDQGCRIQLRFPRVR